MSSLAQTTCFGIEFETTLPANDTTNIGPYHNGYAVPYLPEGWKAERDGSIQCTNGVLFWQFGKWNVEKGIGWTWEQTRGVLGDLERQS